MLDEHEDPEQQHFLDHELRTADETGRNEGHQDEGNPDEVLELIPADGTDGDSKQADPGELGHGRCRARDPPGAAARQDDFQ
jgi:hypothetical protein